MGTSPPEADQDPNLLRKFGQIPEWPKGSDCKSDGSRLRRFESFSAHHEPLAKNE